MAKPRNDRNQAVTKFCLAMEDHRRSDAGRVRTAKEFVAQFFSYDDAGANDRLFSLMPQEVRGPVLSAWGIRGAKAALRDDDEKVRDVIHDALVAGDIDEGIFEDGVTAEILVDWIALPDWWIFWRNGKLTGIAIQKALATARELGLIDDKWFLGHVQGRGGKLKGTDVLCDTLSKDQIVAWIRKLHETGDGSPAGIIAAIGWETVLAKTAQDALLFALDQFARKTGLAPEPPPEPKIEPKAPSLAPPLPPAASVSPVAASAAPGGTSASPVAASAAPVIATASAAAVTAAPATAAPPITPEPQTSRHDKLVDAHPTVSAPADALALAEATALQKHRDSGMPVAIPEIPAIDGMGPISASGGAEDEPPSIPSLEERSVFSQGNEESPKLAEAREAMMKMLSTPDAPSAQPAVTREPWDESEIPAKPSSLEWPEPPPIIASTPAKPAFPSHGAPPPLPQSVKVAAAPAVTDELIPIDEDDLQRASAPKVPVVNPPPVPKRGGPPPRPR